MNGALQSKIQPHSSQKSFDFSDATVKTPPKAQDAAAPKGTSFQDLISNSNEEVMRARAAQQNGDGVKKAKTDEEFAKAMSDKLNRENLRKPQNELDKDSFLKLFITQMQNQDPLSPDKSSEMAAQLAQFNGLEQMMNVNKNLEKMQSEAGLARAVGLIDFVGKDVKLSNGKLGLVDGKVTDGTMTIDADIAGATLEVRDAAGAVIATRSLGVMNRGEHKIEWDGLDNTGKKASGGTYTFAVLAKDSNGQDVAAKITSVVKVTGVDLKDAGGSFYTELGKVRIDEVASVGSLGTLGKAPKVADGNDQKKPAPAPDSEKLVPAGAGDGSSAPGGDGKPASGGADGLQLTKAGPSDAQSQDESKAKSDASTQGLQPIRAASLPPEPLMEIPFAGGA